MSLRGCVRGSGGAGIPAMLTLIDPRGRQAARTVAGPDGEYRLDAPAPGAYTLLTSAASRPQVAVTVTLRYLGPGSAVWHIVELEDPSAGAGLTA